MARIRTIKPEFWDSPGTARASLRARLFFIAMWNWADDYGIGTANGKQLVGFAFPNDDDLTVKDFPSLRKEVADTFGVVFFEHEGRPFFVIPSWDKHQRTERRAKRDEELAAAAERAVLARDSGEVGTSFDTQGSSAELQGASGAGKGTGEREQGNRGTGETREARDFDRFWSVYPRRDDKRRAETAFAKATRRADVEVILGGAQRYADDPNRDPAFTKHPATWLNADSWENGPLPARGGTRPTSAVEAARSVADELREMEAQHAAIGSR